MSKEQIAKQLQDNFGADTHRLKNDFLREHISADEIIFHQATGLPMKAIYKSPFETSKDLKAILNKIDKETP